MTQPPFDIQCRLDHDAILAGAARPVHLALQFTAPLSGQQRSEPCAFALVIDRSGSMGGAPLNYAKQACLTALKHLRPEDHLAVVQFDSEAQVLIPMAPAGTDRTRKTQLLESISAGDSTNLAAGWMLGRDELKKAPAPCRRRLLLLTDGQMNAGICEPLQVVPIVSAGLEKDAIRTSTLGFSDHYDELLLTDLARKSGGQFHDADSPEKLPAIFRAELEGLQAVTIANLRIRLKPLMFCESWSQCSDYHQTPREEGWTEISVGDLVSGEQRSLVLALEVLPLPLQADGKPLTDLQGEELLALEIVWDRVAGGEVVSGRQEQTIRILPTQKPEDIRLNEEVVAVIATQIAGKLVDEASGHLRENRLDAATAVVEKLRRALAAYGDPARIPDAVQLLRSIEQILRDGGFTRRSGKTVTYTAHAARTMSSAQLWTAPESTRAPSYTRLTTDPVPPPQDTAPAPPTPPSPFTTTSSDPSPDHP